VRLNVRVGVIGLGWFGELHCDTVRGVPGLELYGISTRNVNRLTTLQQKYSCSIATVDYQELIADKEVDLIVVCTPPENHAEIAIAALQNDKDVFIEKPIAHDLESASSIITASKGSKGKLFVGHILRFNVRFQEAKEMIDGGEIGELLSVATHRQLPAGRTEELLESTSPFISDAIHDINLILWFTSLTSGEVFAQTSSKRKLKNPDLGQIVIKSDSGVLANLRINWHMPDQTPFAVDEFCQVVGTEGSIYIGNQLDAMHLVNKSGLRVPDLFYWPKRKNGPVGALREEYLSIFKCLRHDQDSELTNIGDSFHALAIALAAERSARYNEVVGFNLLQ